MTEHVCVLVKMNFPLVIGIFSFVRAILNGFLKHRTNYTILCSTNHHPDNDASFEVQQSVTNRCSSYTEAIFNTENCKLISSAYNITFVRRAEHFSSSDFARMEQGAEQKHGK